MDQLLLRFQDNAQLAPYMIFTAGRSRTMWLSAFLTYGICFCNFEATAKVRTFSEVVDALKIPGIGAAETMAAPAWRLLQIAAPTLRAVVVRRSRDEIIKSLQTATENKIELDIIALNKVLGKLERALEVISADPATLTVNFDELEKEETCKAIFEHCLPYKHDHGWWKFMAAKVLDPDIVQLMRLFQSREPQILSLFRETRHLFFRLARQGHITRHRIEGTP